MYRIVEQRTPRRAWVNEQTRPSFSFSDTQKADTNEDSRSAANVSTRERLKAYVYTGSINWIKPNFHLQKYGTERVA